MTTARLRGGYVTYHLHPPGIGYAVRVLAGSLAALLGAYFVACQVNLI